jgi:hypothetical protein
MKIELEFLYARDSFQSRVHEEELIYEGFVPIPLVGECALVAGKEWKVLERHFVYMGSHAAKPGVPDVKVTLQCEEPLSR